MAERNGLAIAALVLGIVGLFTAGGLGLGSLVGVTLAGAALVGVSRGGRDVAWAALSANVFALLTIVTGVLYPAVSTVIGTLAFSPQVDGSVIEVGGRAVGSRLIGQPFSSEKYFWSRPSATGPMPYNGAVSSGSNLGPINPALEQALQDRIAALHAADPSNARPMAR